jgi:glycosyltransferase involved in cell wall biosynthesis
MRVLTIMLGRGLGGIEQAFVDQAEALQAVGCEVLSVTDSRAQIRTVLDRRFLPYRTLRQHGPWDPLAVVYLKRLIADFRPQVVVVHGNRALGFAARIHPRPCPIVAVAHNPWVKRFPKADGCIAITPEIAEHLQRAGVQAERIFVVPNMIAIDPQMWLPMRGWHQPPVIGALGRMVGKKGFSTFIHALGMLRNHDVPFQAMLAGDGPERAALEAQVAKLGLQHQVQFVGWIENKHTFFENIDVFCLPSWQEPFGIVLLEAMRAGVPIVATRSGGPSYILEHQHTALLTAVGDAAQLADALEAILTHPDEALSLAENAYHTVCDRYAVEIVAEELLHVLQRVVQ